MLEFARSSKEAKRLDPHSKLNVISEVNPDKKVPLRSLYYRRQQTNAASDIDECIPDLWIDVKYGERAPKLYEQVYAQQNGYGLIMLWLETFENEDEDEDESNTSKERLRGRQARWQ